MNKNYSHSVRLNRGYASLWLPLSGGFSVYTFPSQRETEVLKSLTFAIISQKTVYWCCSLIKYELDKHKKINGQID